MKNLWPLISLWLEWFAAWRAGRREDAYLLSWRFLILGTALLLAIAMLR